MRKPKTPRLVSKWRADWDLTGTAFGSCEEDQPKAMKRHLSYLKSLRFLLSKEEAHSSYIRESEGAYDQRYS